MDTGEEGRSLNQVWLPSAKCSLWKGTELTTVEVQHCQQLGKMSSSVLIGEGKRWQHTTQCPLVEQRVRVISAGGPRAVRAEKMSLSSLTKDIATTPVFLPGEPPWTEEPRGL